MSMLESGGMLGVGFGAVIKNQVFAAADRSSSHTPPSSSPRVRSWSPVAT